MTQQEMSGAEQGDGEHAAEAGELDPRIQGVLGEQLRRHYDDLVRAPIPDTILLLLAQLEAREAEGGR